ncbi:MAG TPA: hypothetical protein VKB79_20040 [Bryobacteraceae bacterium]|nr:hypothetical protein [Bryobacteraceae bacterium]
MNLGGEPKKVAWLAGIVVAGAGIIYYANFASSDSGAVTVPTATRTAAPTPAAGHTAKVLTDRRRVTNQGLIDDWKPRQGPKNPEDRPDPATIDPAIRLDLLAKVQAVEPAAAGRNLFVFGAAPPPPTAPVPALPKNVSKIAVNQPPPAPAVPAGPPPPPPPPPITLKYYGYKISATDGHKAAFLLDGDDILVAGENDTIKRRYRVVKIGVNSITIEDTQFKNTQTLQLQENPLG